MCPRATRREPTRTMGCCDSSFQPSLVTATPATDRATGTKIVTVSFEYPVVKEAWAKFKSDLVGKGALNSDDSNERVRVVITVLPWTTVKFAPLFEVIMKSRAARWGRLDFVGIQLSTEVKQVPKMPDIDLTENALKAYEEGRLDGTFSYDLGRRIKRPRK